MILGGLDLTQPAIASQLAELTEIDRFPNAVLFSGERFTGRMFASMQICKALGVPPENIVIVSDRNHGDRIRTALALYRKNRNASAKAFLRENVSILLQQYHGALLDGQSTIAGKKRFSDAAEVADLLRDLDSASEAEAEAMAAKLEKACSPLMDGNRSSAITIAQVRAIRDWCSTSDMEGMSKFIIIEGLENALDAAVNALLKTLEEPPKGSHFILISANSGKIPATILSRVRKFRFKDLEPGNVRYILNSLFVDASKYQSLESFFLEGSGVNDALLRSCAKALVAKQDFDMPALVSELEGSQGWDRFFDLVIGEIRDAYNELRMSQRVAQYLLDSVNDAVIKGATFNQMKRLTFEFVVFRIREVNR